MAFHSGEVELLSLPDEKVGGKALSSGVKGARI